MLGADTTLTLLGASALNGSAIVNEGTLILGVRSQNVTHSNRFENAGVLTATGNGTLDTSSMLNSGIVNLAASGSELLISDGNFGNPGSIFIGGGAGVFFGSTGTMTSQGSITVAAGGFFNANGTFTSSGALQVDGSLDTGIVSSIAHLSGAGTVEVSQGYKLAFTNAATESIGPALINDGNVSMGSGGLQFLSVVTNDGTITDSGQMLFQRSLGGDGTLALGPDAVARLFNGAAAGQTVDFSGSGGDLELHKPDHFLGTITGFGGTDQIDLRLTAADGKSFASNTLTVTNGGTTVASLAFAGSYTTGNFALSSDQNGGTLITYQS